MTLHSMAVKKGEDFVMVPLDRFLALPLTERVRWILHEQIRFFDEGGSEIPLKDGARLLREMATNGGPPANGGTPAPVEPAPAEFTGIRRLSVQAFMALPISQRVSLLLEKRVRLQNDRGEEMSVAEALKIARDA